MLLVINSNNSETKCYGYVCDMYIFTPNRV
jgi:hypothetical protein